MQRIKIIGGWLAAVLLCLSGCTPEGYINRVRYQDQTYVNTCESVQPQFERLRAANNELEAVELASSDNTRRNFFALEPGQYTLRGDTLIFRLKNDLNYPLLLDGGVAVQVELMTEAGPYLAEFIPEEPQNIGTLVVDRRYYIANRRPVFMYRFLTRGKKLEGRQLRLEFKLVQYEKDGRTIKSYLCGESSEPLAVVVPPCCGAEVWAGVPFQKIVDVPDLPTHADSFAYGGFVGEFDLVYPDPGSKYPEELPAWVLESFIQTYAERGFPVTQITVNSYASPTGNSLLNQRASQRDANAVARQLRTYHPDLRVSAEGKGEDWLRVEELITRSDALTAAQKAELTEILGRSELDADDRESRLRRLPYWETLEKRVLPRARHTDVRLNFRYNGSLPALPPIAEALPLGGTELERITQSILRVKPYRPGIDVQTQLSRINEVLRRQASANLYALRAEYQQALGNTDQVVEDLGRALKLAAGADSAQLAQAQLAYQVGAALADSRAATKEIYLRLNTVTRENPGERSNFFLRALTLTELGLSEDALREYRQLFDGKTPTGIQWNNRGVAAFQAHRFVEAERDFLRAIELNPGIAPPFFNLSMLKAWRGEFGAALSYLEQALNRDPRLRANVRGNPMFKELAYEPRFQRYL